MKPNDNHRYSDSKFSSLKLVSWGRKRDELAQKDKTIEQAKNELHDAESLLLIDVGNKFRKLQQSRQAPVVAKIREWYRA